VRRWVAVVGGYELALLLALVGGGCAGRAIKTLTTMCWRAVLTGGDGADVVDRQQHRVGVKLVGGVGLHLVYEQLILGVGKRWYIQHSFRPRMREMTRASSERHPRWLEMHSGRSHFGRPGPGHGASVQGAGPFCACC
jgi:hypothetical protein